jgi:hypothetical protein
MQQRGHEAALYTRVRIPPFFFEQFFKLTTNFIRVTRLVLLMVIQAFKLRQLAVISISLPSRINTSAPTLICNIRHLVQLASSVMFYRLFSAITPTASSFCCIDGHSLNLFLYLEYLEFETIIKDNKIDLMLCDVFALACMDATVKSKIPLVVTATFAYTPGKGQLSNPAI